MNDMPELWWSATLGVIERSPHGAHMAYRDGWDSVELPSDAVRLVPAEQHEAWDELRLSAVQPDGRPYNFTARSTATDPGTGVPRTSQVASIARLALGLRSGMDGVATPWTDVRIEQRHVETMRTETEWRAVGENELAEAAREQEDWMRGRR